MTRKIFRSTAGVLALAALPALTACNGSNSPSSPSTGGHLTVKMTDAPTDEVSAVEVYVTGLTIKRSGEAETKIANDLGKIDLLTLQGTTKQLVDLGVPAGTYDFVQVDLDQSRSDVIEKASGDTKPLQIASQEVKVLGGFTVPEGGDTTITLDFDAAASLRHEGNGDWLLTPVILMQSSTSG